MYCKHCGQEIDNNAAVCIHCGVAAGTGKSFCHNCGSPMTEGAAFCMNCGAAAAGANGAGVANAGSKSKIAAGLLGIFLGCYGVHNFYLGYTGKAVAQLLITILTCFSGSIISGVWGLIEGILILTGSEKFKTDAKGTPLSD